MGTTQPRTCLNRLVYRVWLPNRNNQTILSYTMYNTSKMKPIYFLAITVLALTLSGAGCQIIDDPVFDYNLKSAEVIETNNDFGLELLNTVIENEESPNVMISPASVSIALGMVYNGAETTTRDAFEQVLNYEGLTREEVNEITKELISVLVTNVRGNLLEIANSLFNASPLFI